MRIVVNTRLLLKNKLEGIGWFTYESLIRITRNHPECEFVFVFDRNYDKEFIFSSNIIPVVIPPQARHPILYYLWFEYSIPYILNKYKPDLFLSPDGYLSLSSQTKQLAVFHDLNFEHYPKDLPYLERKNYRYFFPRYALKASRIATVSEFSKKDIADKYSVPIEKIDVVYNGVGENYKLLEKEDIFRIKQRISSGKPYFVFVGSLHPRKNLKNLFKAFNQFSLVNKSGIKLVIVGEKKWWTDDIESAFNEIQNKEDVIFTGRLTPLELNNVYGAALALTYVSYFEGFGIPIIEAFKCGTAVITSDVSSLPEVAGDAALYVDPFSIDSISKAMNTIALDEKLRINLIEKGLKRAQSFSWDNTAKNLWASIEKTILEK